MKIAVCGKGGSGKSTITTLLAKELAKMEKKVLVIDSDESNYGLSRQLGMTIPKDFTSFFGGKEKALRDMMLSNFTHQFFNSIWKITDVPEGYYSEKDGVRLMSSGKIHTANEGCACTMGNVISQFIEHLELADDEYALMDMEAGIEHFGRGIDNRMDVILMIVDPSYESLTMTKKVLELGESIRKPVYFVLNKVEDENIEVMRAGVCDNTKIICEFPADRIVREIGLQGKELGIEHKSIIRLARYFTDKLQGNGYHYLEK